MPAESTDEYSPIAEFYDHVIPYRDRPDVAFYVECALQSGGPVLELGCGTGRVLIPTARAGLEIIGLDPSPAMLAVCQRKLDHEPPEVRSKVRLVQGAIQQFDLPERFRLVTLPFRPFQHLLTVEDQLTSLAVIRRHLADRGCLVLDVFNPSLPHLAGSEKEPPVASVEPEFILPDGRRVLRRHRVVAKDLFRQIIEVELIYDITYPDGRREQALHRTQLRYFFRFELEHLLVRSGFEIEALYADYDRAPYGSKYPGELIFVTRKA